MIKEYAFLRTNIYSTNWPASTELCSRQYALSNELLLCDIMFLQIHFVTRGHRSASGPEECSKFEISYHLQ